MDCQKCEYDGLAPMKKVICLGCGRKIKVCSDCFDTFTTCPGEGGCSAKWKEEAKVVLLRPLAPPDNGTPKKRPRKKRKDQLDMFEAG